ncbi:MAG: serine/threonine-protein kinase, partial [Verrucomicrobiota bacterium]
MSDPEPLESSESQPLLEACGHCGADLDVTALEPMDEVVCPACGAVSRARLYLKNYRIESVLGTGGMGSVYKARDLNLNRDVALKVINREFSSDPEHWRKFEEEARITALVNHPNVVKVFSFGVDHGVLFIAMELADKGNFDELMTLQGRIAEAQALDVGVQVAEGLRAAHKRGLIHRDVKPGNILFTDAHTAKIVDFGLACLVDEAAEARGEVWGTPYYVAPEKLNHEPEDFRSDIYSLGATLFHAIAGRPPHEAETASMVALKHIKSKAVSLQAFAPDVSSATAFVINRMLQKDPAARYQTYAELVEHLTYARNKLLDEVEGAYKPRQHVTMESEGQQSLVAWIVLAVLVLILCAGVGLFIFRDRLVKKEESGAAVLKIQSVADKGSVADRYVQGRKLLCGGDYDKAGRIFAELAARPNLPQPLGRWILLHQGMAALLARNSGESKQAFKRLQQRGMFSLDPSDKTLANLFVETGRLLSDDTPITKGVISSYNPADCEAVAFFLFALQDWQLSDFDDAGALFKAFLKSEPTPPFDWISEYKPLAQKYVADFEVYKKIFPRVAEATTLAAKIDLLTELDATKNQPMLPGKMAAKIEQWREDLQQEITREKSAIEQNRTFERTVEHERQNQNMTDAKSKFSRLTEGMQYE